MKLIVISPEASDPRELPVLADLFAAGLTDYHLRKPTWSRDQLAAFLSYVPGEFHRHLVLHSHHDLAEEFALRGAHYGDADGPPSPFLRSRAVHTLAKLRASLDSYDRLLLSPIFPSYSKPGHVPSAELTANDCAELRSLLAEPRHSEVIALGGIDATRIPLCRALGFDGVAVLGTVWQSPNPVAAFRALQRAASGSSYRPSPIASRPAPASHAP